MTEPEDSKKSLVLLGLGAAAGLGLAAMSLFTANFGGSSNLPPGIAAQVNGTDISMEEFGRALTAFEADRRSPASNKERAYVLDRLIEEELLVQRGVAIGLPASDRGVRSALVQSVITSVTAENTARISKAGDVRAFYEQNIELFASSPRLHVRLYRFSSASDAQQAHALLQDDKSLMDISREISIKPDPFVPDGLLPLHKLREYIGPTAMQAAQRLAPSDFSQPLSINGSAGILQLIDRQFTQVPAFEDIEPQVEMAFRKDRDDRSLRDYLSWLKKQADITRASTDKHRSSKGEQNG